MFTQEELDEQQNLPAATPSANPFGGAVRPLSTNAAAETDQQRAIAETQAAMVIAKRFPRDEKEAVDRILNAFSRPTLADKASYVYARGGTEITGPSIRAAETIAQQWGNMQFGIRELEQRNGESTVEAFAWDVQTNTRQVKVFQVPHLRYLSAKNGKPARTVRLEDPRDVYELVANNGARRLRACILGVVPGDVIEAAMNQADITLKTKAEVTPERLTHLLEMFAEFGVTKAAIEKRIQRRLEAMMPAQMVALGKVYNSLRDGMAVAGDYFELDEGATQAGTTATDPKTGAAGLRAAAAKAKANKPADAGAPAETLETVLRKMDAAAERKNGDALDQAASLGDALSADDREKVRESYKALREQLNQEK